MNLSGPLCPFCPAFTARLVAHELHWLAHHVKAVGIDANEAATTSVSLDLSLRDPSTNCLFGNGKTLSSVTDSDEFIHLETLLSYSKVAREEALKVSTSPCSDLLSPKSRKFLGPNGIGICPAN